MRNLGLRVIGSFALLAVLAGGLRLVVALWGRGSAPWAGLDHDVLVDLHAVAVRHPLFTTVMRGISNAGAVMWWFLLTGLCVGLIRYRRERLAILVAIAALASRLLNEVVKAVLDRPRPMLADPVSVASGSSFPSGHTQAAVVGVALILFALSELMSRTVRVAATAVGVSVVVAIAFSRLALGVHYLSDVIGGAILGGLWVVAMIRAYQRWTRQAFSEATFRSIATGTESPGRGPS